MKYTVLPQDPNADQKITVLLERTYLTMAEQRFTVNMAQAFLDRFEMDFDLAAAYAGDIAFCPTEIIDKDDYKRVSALSEEAAHEFPERTIEAPSWIEEARAQRAEMAQKERMEQRGN